MIADKIPPQSLESEAIVLGACMADRETIQIVLPIVRATDFYAHIHGTIFEAITALSESGKPHDKISVAEYLRSRNQLETVGSISYLSKLLDDSLDAVSNAEYHAKLIREKAVLFRLYQAAYKIAEVALNGEVDVPGALAEAEKLVAEAANGFGAPQKGGHIDRVIADVWRELELAGQGHVKALLSPWPALNRMTGGWYPGELVAWFGRPKDGKTSALSQVMVHTAKEHGAVVLFALEMGEESIVRRLIGNRAGIPSRALRAGKLMPSAWDRVGDAITELSGLPVYLYSSARSVSEMRRVLLGIQATIPVKAFIIDHISFVTDVLNGERGSTEHDRLNRAYLRILNIAKELQCVGHVVTHANRAAYDREPTMAHIRGGGNLEGHAHTIIAPYRANPDENPTDGKFLVMANRDGETGAILMHFDGPRNTWTEVA